jgi:hypothetical protein
MRLDKRFPFSTVYGDPIIKYEQGGMNFDKFGDMVVIRKDYVIEHDGYASALAFLTQILKSGPKTKSQVYSAAEQNNQSWTQVKLASREPKFLKFKYGTSEAWKLKDTE